MQLSEKEVENLIFDDLQKSNGEDLRMLGYKNQAMAFSDYHKKPLSVRWFRQFNIDPYGIIDIVGFWKYRGYLHADLIELKACPLTLDHFEQINRYKTGLQVFASQTFDDSYFEISTTLIGTGIENCHYTHNFSTVRIIEYTYGLRGLTFKDHGEHGNWTRTNDEYCNFRSCLKSNKPSIVTLNYENHGEAVH